MRLASNHSNSICSCSHTRGYDQGRACLPVRGALQSHHPGQGAVMISDPIEFELFKNGLFGIADEMALTVFRTTYSGVLKDNMDYSTALFDGDGVLVAQGLTLPGHLGSMPTAIAAVKAAFAGQVDPGDVFILNDPF